MTRTGRWDAVLPLLLLGSVAGLVAGPASAVIVTFEDLNPNDPDPPLAADKGVFALPSGYAGFNWDLNGASGQYILEAGGSGWYGSPPFASNSYAAAFAGGGTLSLWTSISGATFDVNSLWVGWVEYTGGPGSSHKMTITGYNTGSVVQQVVVEPLQVRSVEDSLSLSGFTGLDKLTLSGAPVFIVDDIDISAVPEPSLGLLLLLGVVPVAIARRMRKRNSAAV